MKLADVSSITTNIWKLFIALLAELLYYPFLLQTKKWTKKLFYIY